ncbi:MAG: hypothetical protein HOY78_24500 [Saccharothrix sp.]|nr:hypothetical protein [Saccharothrix sp.]
MTIAEPSGELWSKVEPRTEWPDTDEDMMGRLFFALVDSAAAFRGLAKADVDAVGTAWWDEAGVDLVRTLRWQVAAVSDVADRLDKVGGLAGAFAVDVKDAKSYIRTIVAINQVAYEAAGLVPLVGRRAQRAIVDQVVRWINDKLTSLASTITTRTTVDRAKVVAALGDARSPLERGRDLLQDNANLVNKVSDVIGDGSTVLGLASDATSFSKHPITEAASKALGAASTATGALALGGHLVAREAGAPVADETLVYDKEAVLNGVVQAPLGTTRVLAHQASDELTHPGGTNPSTFYNDLGAYWVPRNDVQTAAALSTSPPLQALVPLSNAVHDGIAEDNSGQAARDEARARARLGVR